MIQDENDVYDDWNAREGIEQQRSSGRQALGWFFALIVIAGIVVALLTGCSTPAIKDRIVEVSVPIATHPVKPADVPMPVTPLPPRPGSLSAAADTLLSKWCAAVAYMLKVDPLLRVSAGMPQQALAKYPECER